MVNFKAAALSALVAAGALAGATGMAQADSILLRFEDDGIGLGIEAGGPRVYDDNRRDDPRWRRHRQDGPDRDWNEDRQPGPDWRRDRDFRRKCSPGRAEAKAEDMGLRRARVVDMDWNRIVVTGRKWGERRTVIFGTAPHCPVRAVR